jgi:hypothetical protein
MCVISASRTLGLTVTATGFACFEELAGTLAGTEAGESATTEVGTGNAQIKRDRRPVKTRSLVDFEIHS